MFVLFEKGEQEALRKACGIVGTNVLALLSDQHLATTPTEYGGAERGFRFPNDPLVLAFPSV
jgi:hypothetical protein